MRFWGAVLAAFVLPSALLAQDLDAALGAAYDKLIADGHIKGPDLPPPRSNAASGTPQGQGDQRLPDPKKDGEEDPNKFVLKNAQRALQKGKYIEAEGNVHFLYKGYEVTCERAYGSLDTEIFVLEGKVLLVAADKVVNGHRVQVDFKNDSFGYLDARTILAPSLLGGQLADNLYVRSEVGGGDRKLMELEDSHITTCDYEHPHYEFTARRSTIRPGKRAIFRDVRLKILGRTVLKVPYLVIPLEKYSERYVPEVGRTEDQGYYIKTNWLTPLRGEDVLGSHFDYFEKLGLGLGADYLYSGANIYGALRLYALTRGLRTLQGSLNHQQNIFGGSLYIDGYYQRNNYLTAPNTTTYSARGSFSLPQRSGTSTFSYFRTGSLTSLYASNQDNIGVTDNRQWNDSLRTDLTVNMTNSESKTFAETGTVVQATRQLDLQFMGTEEFDWATATLEYRRTIPIGRRENFFATEDRTPVIGLRSDARKLFGQKFSRILTFNTEVTWGELVNTADQSRITRATFDINATKDVRSTTSRHQWTLNGRFKQGLYSDDTAQYVLGLGARYSYYVDRETNLNLRYSYLRPYGFTPLTLDRSGRSHLLSADLTYRPGNDFLVKAQTGYDFLQLQQQRTPWQRVSITSEFTHRDNFYARSQTTYDTVSQVWQSFRLDVGWQLGEARLSMGTNFDGQRHTWSNFNLFADGFQIGKLRMGMIFSYNGYNRQVEARHFSFTYDLHCVEAILQVIDNPVGFRAGRQIMFFLRVKALPFDTPFGIGNRGQAIGSGGGVRY